MEEITKQSYSDTVDTEDVEKGRYQPFSSDDQYILPEQRDKLVSAGMKVKRNVWQKPRQDIPSDVATEEGKDEAKAKIFPSDAIKGDHGIPLQRPRQNEPSNAAKEEQDEMKAPILFRDANERAHICPWHLARSWPVSSPPPPPS